MKRAFDIAFSQSFAVARQLVRAACGIVLMVLGNGFVHAESNVLLTSPRGTFRIEEESRRVGAEKDFQFSDTDWIVATADSAQRVRLDEHDDTQSHGFSISPDEQWIYASVHNGSGMAGAKVFRRKTGLQFEKVMDDRPIWKFFEKEALAGKPRPRDWDVAMVGFVSWSADSGRILLSLRAGERVRGHGPIGYYGWYLYYNLRRGRLELSDYLRTLNRHAPKPRADDMLKERPPAIVESLDPLPPPAQIRVRYEAADRRLNELYKAVMEREKPEGGEELQKDERTWLQLRGAGAEEFAAAGPKSERPGRRLQYLTDVTESRVEELESHLKSL